MSLGETVRRIRKMKRIKLKYICGNEIDNGNYWRFEQGKSSISADTFYQIIQNLNVSMEEFSLYHNNFAPDKLSQWGKQMIKAFQVLDHEQLEMIEKLTLDEFNKTQQIKYQHLYYLSMIYLCSIKKEPFDPTWISQLKDYLMNCEQWGYYEVSLFNNSLFCLGDLDTILTLYKRMYKSYLRSKSIHKTPNEEIMLATNIIAMCLMQKSYSKAQEINNLIQSQEIEERSMFARTLLLWCDGLINKIVYKKDEGLEQINMTINIMETLRMDSSAKMFKRWKERLLGTNK